MVFTAQKQLDSSQFVSNGFIIVLGLFGYVTNQIAVYLEQKTRIEIELTDIGVRRRKVRYSLFDNV